MSIIKLNNKAVSNATAFGSISSLGSMVFIKKLTASGSATLSFVDGASSVVLDNTYKEYVFTFKNIHPGTDAKSLQFNLSEDSGSNYNVTKTTTFFRAQHTESGSSVFEYVTGDDLAQSTSAQNISNLCGADNDQCVSGYLTLYNPSSTVFVKHFISVVNSTFTDTDGSANLYMAGYGNTTSAVDAVRFQMSSGNIDAGDICLYGIA
jgi:predicted NAD/FAD-binding protein